MAKKKAEHKRPKTKVIDETPTTPMGPGDRGFLTQEALDARKEIARYLLDPRSFEDNPEVSKERLSSHLLPGAAPALTLTIPFPTGLAPIPKPEADTPDPAAKLKRADVLVITWTVAEQDGLADVLTPGFTRAAKRSAGSKKVWYPYTRLFETKYLPQIRKGAPSRNAKRLGSWMRTQIGTQSVLCFKSELHLNQDSIRDPSNPGTATLPIRDLFNQLIDEVKPKVVLTVGTSGGVFDAHDLGDVVVTRAAKFRLSDEFKNEPFNHQKYTNDWNLPTSRLADAVSLMNSFKDRLVEPGFMPPTKRFPFDGPALKPRISNRPDIKFEDVRINGQTGPLMPKFHPILTTDYFEFGSTTNRLDTEGCAVEMGDAVLGMVCSERDDAPSWAVVRNLSDPVINGDLPTKPARPDMQAHWAVWYYETYGYWTSVMSASDDLGDHRRVALISSAPL